MWLSRNKLPVAVLRLTALAACLVWATPARGAEQLATRILYAPAHFGNSYEVMGEHEMRGCLEEAQRWGFNGYADWFDTVDCADPFEDAHLNLGGALWEKKKTNFRTAQQLGLECYLCLTPNHVFLDQVRPDTVATKGKRIFGQLVCPSKPAGRAVILRNYENLFRSLAEAGVCLKGLTACPYDYGGCACEACNPWILAFSELTRDIFAIAEKHHPGVEMHFVGWWWSAEEHRLFAEWADREAPGWARSIALHIPYGELDVSDAPLPEGCERRAFVHIGYADQARPRDLYGHLGPVIAAGRLERTVAALEAHGCTGFMAYSEGVYEDVNKALLAGLASGKHNTSDEVLTAYARQYFGADETTAARWVPWLRAWGAPYANDAAKSARELKELLSTTSERPWQLEHWAAKTRLLQHHAAIGTGDTWTPERLAAADAFWLEQERMNRRIYGLGPLRHILNRRFSPYPWYKSWAAHQAQVAMEATGEE